MAEISGLVTILRDAIIVLTFVMFVIMLVGFFSLYKKIVNVLDSVKHIADNTAEVTEVISDKIVRPAKAGAGFAFGLGKAAAFIMGTHGKGNGDRKADENVE